MTTDVFVYFPFIILPLVGGMFIWIFLRKDRKHAAEEGHTPAHTESCGGIIGWVTYKGPFIRFAIYSDFLVVSCDKQYYLPFSAIEYIERRSFMFRKGYRIHHRNPEYPKRIELWPGQREIFEKLVAGKVRG